MHYDPAALRIIEDKVHHDKRLCMFPFGAIRTIRSLGLNVKPRFKSQSKRHGFKQYSVDKINLVTVKRASLHDPNIILATVNIQSLKTKELLVSELFDDHAIHVLILTETWLTNKQNDKNWLDVMDLNRDNTSLYIHIGPNSCNGGLALMCTSKYKVKLLKKGNTLSFEYTIWELTVKNGSLMITGVYHPPYSTRNKITNKKFIDNFTKIQHQPTIRT